VSISVCQSLSVGDRLIYAAPDPSISAAGPVAVLARPPHPSPAGQRQLTVAGPAGSAATDTAVTGDSTVTIRASSINSDGARYHSKEGSPTSLPAPTREGYAA
jgi:hypothetical protein